MAANSAMSNIKKAASAVSKAKALIVTAGAGMGVDSGLPDFRGPEGFWRAYPPLKKRGLRLESMSTPSWFEDDPHFAWGFFGHRYSMYRRTEPHEGFQILRRWGENMTHGYFVFTSNVDGHFQKAGFDEERVVECHGSINFLQCTHSEECLSIWPTPSETKFDVDMETLQCQSALPTGPPGKDSLPARPNILMFGDGEWIGDRTESQETRFYDFQESLKKDKVPFVVIEIGAGLAVPTVQYTSNDLVKRSHGTLIRINPNESAVAKRHISLPMTGLSALQQIQELLPQ